MRIYHRSIVIWAGALAALVLSVGGVTAAHAASAKWVSTTRFGREVNLANTTSKAGFEAEDLCNEIVETCQTGTQSTAGGGFAFPTSVAVDPGTGAVYVTGLNNHRVQAFTATGVFVRAFGWEVNKTKVEKNVGTQQEKNVCVAPEECQAGAPGTGLAEQMWPQDVAVDPTTHNVYVGELFYKRIDEYTPQGEFVLMIGGNVDKTKVDEGAPESERDVCTAASKDTCQAGENAPGGLDGYLNQSSGNLLAFGPEGTLYVGDTERVQEFDAAGKHKGEISLAALGSEATVKALAVDQASGEVCLSYSTNLASGEHVGGNVLRCFDTSGHERPHCSTPNAILAIAIDPFGRRELTEANSNNGVVYTPNCEELGVFRPPEGTKSAEGIGLNGSTNEEEIRMYLADEGSQQVEIYKLAPVIEVHTAAGGGVTCGEGTANGSSVSFECVVHGTADAKDVAGTTVWFEYGNTPALGSRTPAQAFSGEGPVNATIEGLRPDESYYYRLAGEDNNTGGQPVTGSTESFNTVSVAPKITCGAPESFYVTFSSALLSCQLNPENSSTAYRFQYGPCHELGSCASASETSPLESSEYGPVGVKRSVSGLIAKQQYRYRLNAVNSHSEESQSSEAEFTTLPAPAPTATTGPPTEISPTTARLNGVVDPDGAQATYSFQLGVYNGSNTVYTTIASGATGAQESSESTGLSNLQPGVTYAYRIALSGAYGTAIGGGVAFTTASLPNVFIEPPSVQFLAIPSISFPKPVVSKSVGKKKSKKPKKKKKKKKGKAKNARSKRHEIGQKARKASGASRP